MKPGRLELLQLFDHCVCQIVTKDFQRVQSLRYVSWPSPKDKNGRLENERTAARVFAEAINFSRARLVL